MNYRKSIIDLIVPYFEADDRYHLLLGDMGFGACDLLKERFPSRITNCGIMEQGMVGIAAGMALAGMKPIVYTIVNFLCFRALEQIRNDVVLQKLDVKFVGTGADNYFDFLGPSHTCGDQDSIILGIVGLNVYDPYTTMLSLESVVDCWMADPEASYIRV